jgi:hypothetical protein
MGEKITWAEGAEQLRALQTLLLQVMSSEGSEVGLVLRTDEPELLIDYLYRAKQKEPLTQDVVVRMSSMGVLVYRAFSKESTDGKEDRSTDDGTPHPGV